MGRGVPERGQDRPGRVSRPLADRGQGPGAGQHRGDRDGQHRGQRVPSAAALSWVGDVGEVVEQAAALAGCQRLKMRAVLSSTDPHQLATRPAWHEEMIAIGMRRRPSGLDARRGHRNKGGRVKAEPPANPADCADNLGTTKYGVDSEGVVVDPRDGSFWVPDEYVPSVLHVAPDGDVLGRFVPTGYESLVDDVFPEVVGQRFRGNRGFEVIVLSPEGTELYTALQSPLQNPTSSTNGSLAIRIFKLDISNPTAPVRVGQWVYLLDPDTPQLKQRPVSGERESWQYGEHAALAGRPHSQSDARRAWNWNGSAPNSFAAENGGCTLEQRFLASPPASWTLPSGAPVPVAKCLYANVAQLLIDAGFVVNGRRRTGSSRGWLW